MYKSVFLRNRPFASRLYHSSGQLKSLAKGNVKTKSVLEVARALQPGTKLHGYTVEKVEDVPELFLTTVSLNHDRTGAKHLHVAREDNNNVFSVAFRTTPMDSTGVPHILEHTVLCGSKKFPVRDPFFKMLNRSLATFMNALTASDWTMYPFSTQNRQDYNNLLSIYLDAVFYPQLRELDFSQEGWRLEHENLQDDNSPINFKGVVYNEMKGVFSNQQNIFAEAVQNKLLPNHTYGVVSGGDPEYIPDLTWEHLKNFHKTHYHPSNARFFTYGNFPLEDHLQYINENYLSQFSKIEADTAVPAEPRWTSPKEASVTCQPDTMAPDPDKQTTVAVNFLLSDITDIEEGTTLNIISNLLTDGETSPFYQALLEANIGSDYSPVIGYNGYTKESSFSVGLQGIHKDDVDKVKQIISETIDKVIEEGFEQSRIDALLHRIELGTKHQTSNFGLGLVMSVASMWNHDGDASEMLRVNNQMELFKKKLQNDPKYLQKKVKEYFKDNSHRLTLVMSPEEEFEEKRRAKEQEKLQNCIQNLSAQDKTKIFQLGQELQETQNRTEDLTCLPCIKLSEIDKEIKLEPTEQTEFDGIPVQYSAQPTNEVTYIKMVSFLDQVPMEMKVYVPLFTNVITKMGAGIYDFKELSHQAELYTGGLSAGTLVSQDPTDPLDFDQGVVFSSYCLERNFDKTLDLWTEIFDRSNLRDSNRLQTLIKMSAADLAASLSNAGHNYAMMHSASSLTPASQLSEMFDGVSQVSVMKRIAELEDNSKIMEHLIELGHEILNKNNLKLCINATPDFMPTALEKVEQFIETLHSDRKPEHHFVKRHTTHVTKFVATSQKTQIELPFSVNYMSKSIKTVPYTHVDFASLRILSRLLSWKFLHREIREKGGAYGGGANCTNGVMSFFSYRDPNSMETLEVFDRSIQWAANGDFTDTDVEEAKITVFQQTDKPVPPGQIGSTLFLNNISDGMRQEARNQLFSVTKENVIEAAQRYLLPDNRPSSLSFLGPENADVAGNKEWKVIKG
ncbi:presequence protease, mitochondrial-like [Mercenaria mercenaria]|uniref:presequence protease, mitochondrial-like n=1 Tax=Mercenaria mercenaria TaxID=6596 RepID=UPI00234F4E7A|nr:presequence protease, mitochondrial-like [Mercenaria mercenaria]